MRFELEQRAVVDQMPHHVEHIIRPLAVTRHNSKQLFITALWIITRLNVRRRCIYIGREIAQIASDNAQTLLVVFCLVIANATDVTVDV